MKRPFAVVGISYLIAQMVAMLCGMAAAAALFCVTVLCALVLFLFVPRRPKWLAAMLVSCMLSFAVSAGYMYFAVRPAQSLQGRTVMVSGRICNAPEYNQERFHYVVETDSILAENTPRRVRFRLSLRSQLDAQYGDRLTAEVRFLSPEDNTVYPRSLLADRIMLTAVMADYTDRPQITSGEPSLYGSIIELREKFVSNAAGLLGDELGGLLAGMLVGDTSGIDSLTLTDFRDSGLSHIFSVSGLHFTLLTGAVYFLFQWFSSNYRTASVLSLPFALFLMAFTGFSPTVVRAGVMTVLMLAARIIRRESDPLNSLGIAALVICGRNPCAAADAGLLMSFAATAGLTLLYPRVLGLLRGAVRFNPRGRFSFALRPVLGVTAASVVASLCTFPIQVLCFGQVSLIAPLANAVCLFPAEAFLVLGAAASAAAFVPFAGSVVGLVLYAPLWLLGRLVTVEADLLARLPGAGVAMNYPFVPFMLGLWLCLLGMYFLLYYKDKHRAVGVLLCAALCIQVLMMGAFTHNAAHFVRQSVMIFDTDGGCMVSLVSGGQCVIVGAGGSNYHSYLASRKLAEQNITEAEAVVLPENEERYIRSAERIVEEYSPDSVFMRDGTAAGESIEALCGRLGTKLYLADNAIMSMDGCDISFECYVDADGQVWVWAQCGVSVLICPQEGDCMLLPGEYTAPSVMIVPDSSIKNITVVDALAVVVTADRESCAAEGSIIEYRGMSNVYTVEENRCLELSPSGQGVSVRQH